MKQLKINETVKYKNKWKNYLIENALKAKVFDFKNTFHIVDS